MLATKQFKNVLAENAAHAAQLAEGRSSIGVWGLGTS